MAVIILLVLLYAMLFRYKRQNEALFLPGLIEGDASSLYWLKAWLLCGCWICATVALMQPVGNGHYLEGKVAADGPSERGKFKRKAHDVIFLIDVSASMTVKDTRLKTSRLEQAKDIADQIMATFNGESAALYAFTSEVDKLSPLTPDAFFVRMMLQNTEINQGGIPGTDLFAALSSMREKYFSVPSPKLKTLILLSDGGDTTLEELEDNARQLAIDNLGNMVADAEKMHLRVFTIGVGSQKGADVPDVMFHGRPVPSKLLAAPLQKLALVGRGAYFDANSTTSLDIATAIRQQMLQDPPYYDEKEKLIAGSLLQAILGESPIIYDRYFQYPLALAVLVLLFSFVLPSSWRLPKRGLS
jgi:Ca-activated chloride channel family protein